MKVLVVVGHPSKGSLNHAIADRAVKALAANGHEVMYHDLYAEGFDPVLAAEDIPKEAELDSVLSGHCRELAEADGIIIVHPDWWGQPPAMLKGWVDRVFRPGSAYEFIEGDGGEGVPRGLLRAKASLVFNTANTPPGRERAVFGDPLERIWRDCIFALCGVKVFHRKVFSVVITSTEKERKGWLRDVESEVDRLFPPERR